MPSGRKQRIVRRAYWFMLSNIGYKSLVTVQFVIYHTASYTYITHIRTINSMSRYGLLPFVDYSKINAGLYNLLKVLSHKNIRLFIQLFRHH
jgi:hypothetical protein